MSVKFKYSFAIMGDLKFYRPANEIRWTANGKQYVYPCRSKKEFNAIVEFFDVLRSLDERIVLC